MLNELQTEAVKKGFYRYANREDFYRSGAKMSEPSGTYIDINADRIRVYRETFVPDNGVCPAHWDRTTVVVFHTVENLIAWINVHGEHRPGLPAFSNSWD